MQKQHKLSLLSSEISHHQYDAVITLATIFTGDTPNSYLSDRVAAIFAKNPWLKARLTTTDDSQLHIKINETTPHSEHYQEVNIADICDNGSIECFMAAVNTPPLQPKLASLFTKQGFKCINNDIPLFKVSLCQSDSDTFVLLVSMSHILGDGATLYRIYNMLSQEAEIVSLNPDRVMKFQHDMVKNGYTIGSFWSVQDQPTFSHKAQALQSSTAMCSTPMSRLISGLNVANLPNGKERSADFSGGYFHVNQDWLQVEKARHVPSTSAPWLSSNDILSAWFMRTSQTSLGVVAINSRPHLATLDNDRVGNYQVGILFTPHEYQTASDIRQSIQQFPAKNQDEHCCDKVDSVALVSNWSAFYNQLTLGDNCHEIVHFPVIPPELNSPAVVEATMIIFKPNKDQLAVAIGVEGLEKYLADNTLSAPLFSQ